MSASVVCQPAKMRAVTIPRFGEADVMEVAEVPVPIPGEGDVLIRVAAAGINRGDLAQRRGRYPPPPGISLVPGLEVSGTVVATGRKVTRLKVGDEVCAILAGGGYAQYCVAPEGQCMECPAGLDLVEAASLPESFCTVWDAVWEQGGLQPRERLLVHGGAGGIGVVAIQIAAALGNPVYATAGTDEKCATCTALGATRAINYRVSDFVQEVRTSTNGAGVDLVLDSIGGSYVRRNISLLALNGRHISIGVQESREAAIDILELMQKRIKLVGTTLRFRGVDYKSGVCAEVQRRLWPLFRNGQLRTVVDQVFPLEEVARAHQLMEASSHIGKLLLIP